MQIFLTLILIFIALFTCAVAMLNWGDNQKIKAELAEIHKQLPLKVIRNAPRNIRHD